MSGLDLFDLREMFSEQKIMICFNGPFSKSIIEELGNAVKRYMENEAVERNSMADVFSVYIEQAQNIRNYAQGKKVPEIERVILESGILVIARKGSNYVVSSGNMIEQNDVEPLRAHLDRLRGLDKAALKTLYKEQLRKPRDPSARTGAGLGLIDMARKAAEPLGYAMRPMGDQYSFFSLQTVV